jgi:hypothetical protein
MKTQGKALLIFVVITLIATACHRKNTVVVVNSFPIEKKVVYDSSGTIDILDQYVRIAVNNDYLFLVGNMTDIIFRQFALPRVDYIKSFGHRGRGPGEYIKTPDIYISPTTELLYIYRPEISAFYSYKISNAGDLSFEHEFKVERGILYNQFHIIGDSLLVYNKVPELGIGRVDLRTGRSIGDLPFPIRDGYEETDYYHPDKGVLAANGEYIAYAYHFLKQIDIYNISDLSLKARIIGAGHKEPTHLDENSDMYYYNVYCTDKYIYAYYAAPNARNGGENNYIEVYDYDGRPIARYDVGVPIGGMFAITPNDSTLYGYSHLHENRILKYNLQ